MTKSYNRAETILEYGSGGSTVVAAERPAGRCFSVESDKDWALGVSNWIDQNVPGNSVTVHHADIGATGKWGYPNPKKRYDRQKYLEYTQSVWARPDFVHPDLVLIDGRYRVGCFLSVIAKIEKPTTILFDDYTMRRHYHVVERIFKPSQIVGGRMAVFEVEPRQLSRMEQILLWRKTLSPR